MYDPTEFIGNFWFGYICRHCRVDYGCSNSPRIERLNPLRYEIGFGRKRPARLIWNRQAWMQCTWSNFNWWVWKRFYRKVFGYPARKRP